MAIKKSFNILSDGSWLSLAKVGIFKEKVLQSCPDVELDLISDEESVKSDFYIDDSNTSNKQFSVVIKRDLLNEIVVFNFDILDKINAGLPIIIGSSIPGQTLMAINFLEKALPNLNKQPIDFDFRFLNGNILERLNKLDTGELDAVILSAADLNILQSFELSKNVIKQLLTDKKIMLLPLFECPPAVRQGATIVYADINNLDAIEVLKNIKNEELDNALKEESDFAQQRREKDVMAFGSFHIETGKIAFDYEFGIDKKGKESSGWRYKMKLDSIGKKIFSSAAFMKDFFTYQYFDEIHLNESCEAVFIASHKAIHSPKIKKAIADKRVWAAGTRSWFQLAKQGIWVEGCADGIGLEWLQSIFETELVNLNKTNITVVTNAASAIEWQQEGWQATASYELVPNFSQEIADAVSSAQILFWTSFQQFQQYKNFVQPNAQHACPAGKTADFLLKDGLKPFIFPTIKAFQDWQP